MANSIGMFFIRFLNAYVTDASVTSLSSRKDAPVLD
jgi:hypothetical protein